MIEIEKIIPGGQGLGVLEDKKKAFFWNALPGEVVEDYVVTKKKSHYIDGIATKVNELSSSRVAPKDLCYLATSPWQIMRFQDELDYKVDLVVETFRQNQLEISRPEIVSDNKEYFYRNKMEYALYWDNDENKIKLAFHERGSHRKIPINQSSIERKEIFEAAQKIIEDLNDQRAEARKFQSLLLRCDQTGKVSGGLLENGKPHPVFPVLKDTILGVEYSYSVNGFFQINLPVYERALLEIKKYIETEEVLDLYAGVGTIGLSVAREKKLKLVECNNMAYGEAVKNAEGLGGVEVILEKSENALEHINAEQTVILDPPRAGCDQSLIDKLLEVHPKKIIYLSCNPITQARDIKKLIGEYEIENIKTFNFFPRTPHIENLVILR